ncbi:MAG: hypothetical protein HY360_22995 [Verrucomicrobia bacterium]|nr:hypothetical protein [Verrucomicrobiota bacterium]
MKMRDIMLAALILSLARHEAPAATEDDNLIKNGGFEETREEALTGGGHFLQALKDGCDFGAELFAPVPKNFDQFIGKPKCFKVVKGSAGKEVHSGGKALLFNGFFYIQDTLTVKNGNSFAVQYYAKGDGKTRLRFVVRDAERRETSQAGPPKPVQVTSDDWTLVNYTLDINDEQAYRASILLEAEGDITMDDLRITESEKKPAPDAKQP